MTVLISIFRGCGHHFTDGKIDLRPFAKRSPYWHYFIPSPFLTFDGVELTEWCIIPCIFTEVGIYIPLSPVETDLCRGIRNEREPAPCRSFCVRIQRSRIRYLGRWSVCRFSKICSLPRISDCRTLNGGCWMVWTGRQSLLARVESWIVQEFAVPVQTLLISWKTGTIISLIVKISWHICIIFV